MFHTVAFSQSNLADEPDQPFSARFSINVAGSPLSAALDAS
jgi:hypothetical protein